MSIVGLGTDIVEINRFDMPDEQRERLAKRVLTESELAIYRQHKQPVRYLAKRFAAKEAVVKAAGLGIGNGISFQHAEISNLPSGAPQLMVSGALQSWCEKQGVSSIHLSLSDEQHYAVATVILERG
ncbi:holo-ACP synthase [Bowmanella sp. JS7-9]|uniref:Holo-[acyl-carrier-protein] synthase n=1 Tax=Pseudobowmanella zhangzhouensis TaxID=1537679 RepID=A0ABW1XFJ9_9ALTE|nr:holo-ACP synthase [Bowmanella sp. JS7-9]TBX21333.1 ACP synthase [Bowmanella sp. JS7-9]